MILNTEDFRENRNVRKYFDFPVKNDVVNLIISHRRVKMVPNLRLLARRKIRSAEMISEKREKLLLYVIKEFSNMLPEILIF